MSENKDKVKKILTGIRNSEIELLEVIQEFNNEKIIHASKEYLDRHYKESMKSLDAIEDSKIKEILIDINNYLIKRSN